MMLRHVSQVSQTALNVLSLYFFLGFEEVTLKMSKSEEPLHFNY